MANDDEAAAANISKPFTLLLLRELFPFGRFSCASVTKYTLEKKLGHFCYCDKENQDNVIYLV